MDVAVGLQATGRCLSLIHGLKAGLTHSAQTVLVPPSGGSLPGTSVPESERFGQQLWSEAAARGVNAYGYSPSTSVML